MKWRYCVSIECDLERLHEQDVFISRVCVAQFHSAEVKGNHHTQ